MVVATVAQVTSMAELAESLDLIDPDADQFEVRWDQRADRLTVEHLGRRWEIADDGTRTELIEV